LVHLAVFVHQDGGLMWTLLLSLVELMASRTTHLPANSFLWRLHVAVVVLAHEWQPGLVHARATGLPLDLMSETGLPALSTKVKSGARCPALPACAVAVVNEPMGRTRATRSIRPKVLN
jgi:hypothetical protein